MESRQTMGEVKVGGGNCQNKRKIHFYQGWVSAEMRS